MSGYVRYLFLSYFRYSGLCCFVFCVFFFKQKTAYEMRISDWSSDVCSSDLIGQFPLTRQLLTVKCDCDLAGHVDHIDDLAPRQPDTDTLQALYERYGFRTWLRELTGDAQRVPQGDARVIAEAPAAPAELRYQIISTWPAFDEWMAQAAEAPLVALDTETTSLDEMQASLVGMSMALTPGVACYIPLAHRGPDSAEQLPKHEVLERMRGDRKSTRLNSSH